VNILKVMTLVALALLSQQPVILIMMDLMILLSETIGISTMLGKVMFTLVVILQIPLSTWNLKVNFYIISQLMLAQ